MLTGTKKKNSHFASNEDKAQSDAKVTQGSCGKKSLWEYLGRTEERRGRWVLANLRSAVGLLW